jgi:hypothetical protein
MRAQKLLSDSGVFPENVVTFEEIPKKRIVCPKIVTGNVQCQALKYAKDIVLPELVQGSVFLNNIESTEGLVLPKKIHGSLFLCRLSSAENLVLPKKIGGSLNLDGLTSAKHLVLPEYIGCNLRLYALTSTRDLVLPRYIGNAIYFGSMKESECLILPKRLNHLEIIGKCLLRIGQKIYVNNDIRHSVSTRIEILPPMNKKSLGDWLKTYNSFSFSKEILVSILSKTYTRKEAKILADSILAAKMLTS